MDKSSRERVPLSRPDISDLEVEEVLQVLRTHTLSLGPKLDEFEERMAALLGVRHAVAVSSGTAGLHLAVRAAGIKTGDEVITTPFSFVASANVLLFERATPVFVDIDDDTLNLTPAGVEDAIARLYLPTSTGLINRRTGGRLAGLLPVDVFGHPVEIEGFRAVTARWGLRLIEDACEALGSEVQTRAHGWVKAGSLADVAVFAFYPNKQMTTGEGGLVATNDERIARLCRSERNQGRAEGPAWLHHETLGFNYRMDELSAALGVAQARRFDELVRRRRDVARRYDAAIAGIPDLRLPRAQPWARVNWFVYVVRVDARVDREAVQVALRRAGVESRAYFPPIHLQPVYRRRLGSSPGPFPVCEAAAQQTLALPFFNALTDEQIACVADGLRGGVRRRDATVPA